jgi:predicted dehydrogenase
MEDRRTFLKASAAAVAASRSVRGANDNIRLGLIGCGTRGGMLRRFFAKHSDCAIMAACDVSKSRLDQTVATLGVGVDGYGDYRRILERKDIDAVIVATPDHWHSPITVQACAAGKDVYVEKPVSNTISAAQEMVTAARKYDRVVQVGLMQRSTPHFQEAAKLIQDGYLGPITHAVLCYGGGYTRPPEPVSAPPPDLDWEMFQGPAPRRPYKASRQRSWRSYYDYGGGLITDWGVHLIDVAHWFLNADTKAPLLTSTSAQSVNIQVPEHDQVPDAFICSWQYDKFVMSFTNAVIPNPGFPFEGSWFFGSRGCLLIHRSGYMIRAGQRGRPAAGGLPPVESQVHPVKEDYQNDENAVVHARNFLDCMRSRKRPTVDIEVGFYSTLPALLALLSIQQGRSFTWDGKAARPA